MLKRASQGLVVTRELLSDGEFHYIGELMTLMKNAIPPEDAIRVFDGHYVHYPLTPVMAALSLNEKIHRGRRWILAGWLRYIGVEFRGPRVGPSKMCRLPCVVNARDWLDGVLGEGA